MQLLLNARDPFLAFFVCVILGSSNWLVVAVLYQFEYETVWLPATIANTWEKGHVLSKRAKGFEKQIKVRE